MGKQINARHKGHNLERQIRLEFIEMGWKDCQTSRYGSKEMDDALCDLIHTDPFNLQCKAWEHAPSYHDILSEMPQNENINIIIHKRNRKGEVVVMKKEDFYRILKLLGLPRHQPTKPQAAKRT